MISILLGAGYSYVGGVPLASQLFDRKPLVDRITRRNLVEGVQAGWVSWHEQNEGAPEQYLAFLENRHDKQWTDAIWYVGLIIALATSRVERVGRNPTITRHNIDRTTQVPVLEEFWSTIFRRTEDINVVTTNYDILAERGLRHEPRPRVPRPGFNYGEGPEILAGGGYPSYSHIQRISVEGRVPLLKLHGSVSWGFRDRKLVKYHDCRPAVRGDPAIVAPVTSKKIPTWLEATWDLASHALSKSDVWIVVGYSLPNYDLLVRELLRSSGSHSPQIRVFDPNPQVSSKFASLIPGAKVSSHQGLPQGVKDLEDFLDEL